MKNFFFLFSFFLMIGCQENFPVYSSYCEEGVLAPECVRLAVVDPKDKIVLLEKLGIKENVDCPYRLELTRYRIGACNNPLVKSVGSDFNGYVRISIKKGLKCYYKVQSDYKNDENGALERVLEHLKKEKVIKNFFN